MQWIEVTIDTSPAGTEILPGLLLDYNITDVQIINNEEAREYLSSADNWDYKDDFLAGEAAAVRFYLPLTAREELARLEADLQKFEIPDMGSLALRQTVVDDEDWLHAWKESYKPFAIGRVVVCPFWEEYQAREGETVFTIDPGNIFGTGLHATTKMCVLALQELLAAPYDKPDRAHPDKARLVPTRPKVLDLGCGSGILSIVAMLLGADSALALDIDPAAVAAEKNAALNNIERYTVRIADIFAEPPAGKFDLVLANIVADVLIRLAPTVRGLLVEDGIFIASGIIDGRLEEVRAAVEVDGLEVAAHHEMEGWHCLVCRNSL